jgi:hypothetical protein
MSPGVRSTTLSLYVQEQLLGVTGLDKFCNSRIAQTQPALSRINTRASISNIQNRRDLIRGEIVIPIALVLTVKVGNRLIKKKYTQNVLSRESNSTHFSTGQAVGTKEVDDGIWLVSFMDYDLGYIDLEEKILQPLNNPFGPRM